MGVLRDQLAEIKTSVAGAATAANTEIQGLEAEIAAIAPALDAVLAPIPAKVAAAKADVEKKVQELIATIEALNT
jgi:hypothetical protein